MAKNEVEKLLEVTEEEPKVDQLDQPLEEEQKNVEELPKEVDPEEAEESVKNRRHKRLEAKLQKEREANIALNARLSQIAESKAVREGSEAADYLKSVERIYGTQSPEAIEATNILKSALEGVEKTATERALKTFREEQAKEREAIKKEEAQLDSFIEDIEDTYGVSINEETERGFFKYLDRISPKSEDGSVIAYADHQAAWEDYSEKIKASKPINKAKTLASRSMVQSGASGDSKLVEDSTTRYLKENDLI